jgi:hypothetical protein
MLYVRLKSGGYRLDQDWWVEHPLLAGCAARVEGFVEQSQAGRMTLRRGYQWDGPSGPTLDTPNFMAGSLMHDGGYQLLRGGHAPTEWRKRYDQVLYDICRAHGMGWLRAQYVYWCLRVFASSAAARRPEVEDTELSA